MITNKNINQLEISRNRKAGTAIVSSDKSQAFLLGDGMGEQRNFKHGESGTKLYYVWIDMRQRCRQPKSSKYKHYGNRGITICKEWESYIQFKVWAIENGYRLGLTIDRIDNDGNYSPGNCRWTTQKRQRNNSRQNKMITYKGKTQSMSDWADQLKFNYTSFQNRISRGWTPQKAIEKPMGSRGANQYLP